MILYYYPEDPNIRRKINKIFRMKIGLFVNYKNLIQSSND